MKKNQNSALSRGFSLIELLVVVAIIGILAGIVYANFGDARAVARDEARKVALKELQLAIELYKAQNGRYPQAGCGRSAWSGGPSGSYACAEYIVGLVPDYIPSLPRDPRENGSNAYLYRVDPAGTSYKLLANNTVEIVRIQSYQDEFARCPRSFGNGWCGTSPQATSYAVYAGSAGLGW